MADAGQLSDQEAARRRRRWLAERHARTRALLVVLLRQAPEAEAAALDQLPGGELQRLARLLTHASDPQQDQDTQPAGTPPVQPAPSSATSPRP